MPASKKIAPVARSSRGLPDAPFADELLRMPDVCERITLSDSTIHAMVAVGQFPRSIELGPHMKVWPAYLVDAWLASRIEARDAMSSPHDVVVMPPWDPALEDCVCQHGIRMMRRPAVERRILYRRNKIYEMIRDESFPGSVPIGVRARAWVQTEVDAWLRERHEARRREDPGFAYLTSPPPE